MQLTCAGFLNASGVLAQAKESLEQAQINLDFSNVVAPISGRIDRRFVTPGPTPNGTGSNQIGTVDLSSLDYTHKTDSYALFGNLTYDFTDNFTVTGGLRFEDETLGHFDLALNYGNNRVDSTDRDAINPSWGNASPSTIYTGRREADQTNLTLDWTRDYANDWLFKPLTVSAGLAWRQENYELSAGEAAGWQNGALFNTVDPVSGRRIPGYYSGITQVDAASLDRRVFGAYVDLEGQLTDKFQAGVALRSEHYSDFGDTTNGKLSLRYDFTPQIAARATASTGYRAPSLVQSGLSSFSVQVVEQPPGSGNWVEVQQRTLRADSPEAALLGGAIGGELGFLGEQLIEQRTQRRDVGGQGGTDVHRLGIQVGEEERTVSGTCRIRARAAAFNQAPDRCCIASSHWPGASSPDPR